MAGRVLFTWRWEREWGIMVVMTTCPERGLRIRCGMFSTVQAACMERGCKELQTTLSVLGDMFGHKGTHCCTCAIGPRTAARLATDPSSRVHVWPCKRLTSMSCAPLASVMRHSNACTPPTPPFAICVVPSGVIGFISEKVVKIKDSL